MDSLRRIRSIDSGNMVESLMKFPDACEDAVRMANGFDIPSNYANVKNVVITGMGGSAIGGDMLRDLFLSKSSVPIDVVREYELPAYVDSGTLVFVISYSGNTEETLSSFVDAVKRNCMIIGVTSGGMLEEFCEKLGVPCLKIPAKIAPRAALPYLFFVPLVILRRLGVIQMSDDEISDAMTTLHKLRDEISIEVKMEKNPAKRLASCVFGTVPVIYGASIFKAAAVRMKTQINENSKMLAKSGAFPEINHNEIVGWEGLGDLARHFSVILIRDAVEDERTRVRMEVTKDLIRERRGKVFEVWSEGKSLVARLLSVVYLGDFTSFYLAILYGVNPKPVDSISKVKDRLGRLRTVSELRSLVEKLAKGR